MVRSLRLGKWAEWCRFTAQYLLRYRNNQSYVRQHPDFLFPPAWFMYETYSLSYRDYAEDGLQTAGELLSLVRPFIKPDEDRPVILDWGCGPGRIVRHLPGLTAGRPVIYGTDYNPAYVEWCAGAIRDVQFLQNGLLPPVSLPGNTCAFIYGISIFTHLSAESHTLWAAELYRLLRPGGVLLLTVQGLPSRQKLLPAEQERFDRGELVVRHYEKEGNRLFAAFQPAAFMRVLLSAFELLQHITGGTPGALDHTQDTWIVRKPMP